MLDNINNKQHRKIVESNIISKMIKKQFFLRGEGSTSLYLVQLVQNNYNILYLNFFFFYWLIINYTYSQYFSHDF